MTHFLALYRSFNECFFCCLYVLFVFVLINDNLMSPLRRLQRNLLLMWFLALYWYVLCSFLLFLCKFIFPSFGFEIIHLRNGAWGGIVVKTLSDGPGIDSRWCHWIFQWHIPSDRTIALGSTQPLVKMSTRKISWGVKATGAWGWRPYKLHVPNVMKIWEPNLLEPSGSHRACYGTPLPFTSKEFICSTKPFCLTCSEC